MTILISFYTPSSQKRLIRFTELRWKTNRQMWVIILEDTKGCFDVSSDQKNSQTEVKGSMITHSKQRLADMTKYITRLFKMIHNRALRN